LHLHQADDLPAALGKNSCRLYEPDAVWREFMVALNFRRRNPSGFLPPLASGKLARKTARLLCVPSSKLIKYALQVAQNLI
jgi:hypothetical protein